MNKPRANRIPFNRPLVLGEEMQELGRLLDTGVFAGGGRYSGLCSTVLERKIGCRKAIMTSSCTDALEMSALLLDIRPGDEVILPSYTFVSTASAFALRGAKLVWCDIRRDTKNLDETRIGALFTPKTRAVAVVHYGGVGCELDAIAALCRDRGVFLVEDAAQAIDCTYRGKPLGSFGDLATLSFHETKNIQCGEGGALLVNNPALVERAEILRDKGTDRTRFLKGLVDKYTWVDLGSSFLMSELQASFLFAQLKDSRKVSARRRALWSRYRQNLADAAPLAMLPFAPDHCVHNGHLFYLLCESLEARERLNAFMRSRNVMTHFHYVPLHSAPYWKGEYAAVALPVTDATSNGLLRLPMHYDLAEADVDYVCDCVRDYLGQGR